MRKLYLLVIFSLTFFSLTPKESKYYVRMADSEMKRNPESWMLDFSKKLKWK